ncbi:hypothetical protein GGX14DRAFT_360272 [Mycena pura]|uniref:Uncharacterized protein n=1 Tax=Mycena pura TaxID=153505 RepID=A0AAD6VII2_9AGAR|nr:hypothetical protein GGX14DRAFT_360272 [Mycena pura]
MFSSPSSFGCLAVLSLLCQAVDASPAQSPFHIDQAPQYDDDDGASAGWLDPRPGGGRMLDYTTRTRGEPLNVIISGTSDPFVLNDEGFTVYVSSLGYSKECMGMHMGRLHLANLGDGDGRKPEELLFRQNYRVPGWGTCWESFVGGQHFRAWRQNGTEANSGAWFLAASKEEDSRRHHTIVANGYNLGRDWLVEQALAGSELWWRAEVEWRWGLLEPGRKGVNHNIAQDGRVAVLTVFRVQSDLD